jgi:hypothetical protein
MIRHRGNVPETGRGRAVQRAGHSVRHKAPVMALPQTLAGTAAWVLAFTAPGPPADALVVKTKFLRYINPYCA